MSKSLSMDATPVAEGAYPFSSFERPRDAAGIDAWIARSDEKRGFAKRVSGYVKAEGLDYHVALTLDGPIVCALQWKPTEKGTLSPRHNLFCVTAEQRTIALDAWAAKLKEEDRHRAEDSQNDELRPAVRATGRLR